MQAHGFSLSAAALRRVVRLSTGEGERGLTAGGEQELAIRIVELAAVRQREHEPGDGSTAADQRKHDVASVELRDGPVLIALGPCGRRNDHELALLNRVVQRRQSGNWKRDRRG